MRKEEPLDFNEIAKKVTNQATNGKPYRVTVKTFDRNGKPFINLWFSNGNKKEDHAAEMTVIALLRIIQKDIE